PRRVLCVRLRPSESRGHTLDDGRALPAPGDMEERVHAETNGVPRARFRAETIARLQRDPSALFAEWAKAGAMRRVLPGVWIVSSYDEAATVIRDYRRF